MFSSHIWHILVKNLSRVKESDKQNKIKFFFSCIISFLKGAVQVKSNYKLSTFQIGFIYIFISTHNRYKYLTENAMLAKLSVLSKDSLKTDQ